MKNLLLSATLIVALALTAFAISKTNSPVETINDTNIVKAVVNTETASLESEEAIYTTPVTSINFQDMTWDFGKIAADEKVNHTFSFTNTGNEPLIIEGVKTSCGCTASNWPKEPIAPGASGDIDISFNPKGKTGRQTKTITVNANTDPSPLRLVIKAEIEKI